LDGLLEGDWGGDLRGLLEGDFNKEGLLEGDFDGLLEGDWDGDLFRLFEGDFGGALRRSPVFHTVKEFYQ
jgi:hypothetical protein